MKYFVDGDEFNCYQKRRVSVSAGSGVELAESDKFEECSCLIDTAEVMVFSNRMMIANSLFV